MGQNKNMKNIGTKTTLTTAEPSQAEHYEWTLNKQQTLEEQTTYSCYPTRNSSLKISRKKSSDKKSTRNNNY
jgi:hypothetical protein